MKDTVISVAIIAVTLLAATAVAKAMGVNL